MPSFPFDNSYARLSEVFYSRCDPTPVAEPALMALNRPLAEELGLDLEGLDEKTLAAIFSGNQVPDGAEPLAMAYAGHQFGNFVPQLGDGRAILLGEVIDHCQQRRDIQLKGSGRTPFSRGGDGRAPLGPVMREYLVSEAMHALGVPTTRSLAAVTTGEPVYRESPLPGAVLTRVASSHIRVGTFQYFGARDDIDSLRELADYVIARHYPEAAFSDHRYLSLLEAVIDRQARLVAHWMSLGFIHGVLNTDNVSICGETLDYGPCAFMDDFHPDRVFSYIDTGGRYAWRRQPLLTHWNMARLAEALLPLLDEDHHRAVDLANSAIGAFMPCYEAAWQEHMAAKIGLTTTEEDDSALIDDLLTAMADNEVDFTSLFRSLCDAVEAPTIATASRQLFRDPSAWDAWAQRWASRLGREPGGAGQRADRMRQTNPAIIPRNHRIEQAIDKAVADADFSDFQLLDRVLRHPYDADPELEASMGPPADSERVHRTFCGT